MRKPHLILMMMFVVLFSCKKVEEKKAIKEDHPQKTYKLSLAQWSIHKMIISGKISPFDFASKAKEWGFDGIEYVSQLYSNELKKFDNQEEGMKQLITRLKAESDKAGVKNLIIMVDNEGDLADPDEKVRNQAVENHKKWVDAAAALGCHSIRVNSFGTNDPAKWEVSATDGLKKLADYGATKNVKILVENHGWLSSDADLVMKVINGLNHDYVGTLPDFGNWCIKRKDGARWGACEEEYPDMYDGIKKMMPAAKAVSAKSYDFDKDGNETKIDYYKMMQIVKDANYSGFIGVEYEGNNFSEEEGIKATRDLILKAIK